MKGREDSGGAAVESGMTTLREVTEEARARRVSAEARKTQEQIAKVLKFCRPFAEKGEQEATYSGCVSEKARKALQEGPERLKFKDVGDGVADVWVISWL